MAERLFLGAIVPPYYMMLPPTLPAKMFGMGQKVSSPLA